MGCGASSGTVNLRVDSYRDCSSSANNTEKPVKRPDGSSSTGCRPVDGRNSSRVGDGPPSLGTLEAKHTSLAEDWARQKELARQPTRQSSNQAQRADYGSRPGADSQ